MSRIDDIRTGLAADLVVLEEQNQLSEEIMAEITTVYTSVYNTLTEIKINRGSNDE